MEKPLSVSMNACCGLEQDCLLQHDLNSHEWLFYSASHEHANSEKFFCCQAYYVNVYECSGGVWSRSWS